MEQIHAWRVDMLTRTAAQQLARTSRDRQSGVERGDGSSHACMGLGVADQPGWLRLQRAGGIVIAMVLERPDAAALLTGAFEGLCQPPS
jgi:hypothetical protein